MLDIITAKDRKNDV